MISFEEHKQDAERWLANATDKASPALVRALHIIVELAERGKALEAENARKAEQIAALMNVHPSTKEYLGLHVRFMCSDPFERARIAVQLASLMPEACVYIHKLEAENADLKNQLREAMEKY